MPTRLRSYSKINLGLAIGAPRADGYHSLATLYQTLGLYDLLTVSARRASETRLRLSCSDPRVPLDGRNTVWKMLERAIARLGINAEVAVHIEKRLPIQGGMGAGSANAAAALLGLERELGMKLTEAARLEVAAAVGSDVPLFLLGGAVLGSDRGQVVRAVGDLGLPGADEIPCVVALPRHGVSTPLAFRDWDRRFTLPAGGGPDLHSAPIHDTVEELSRIYASVFLSDRESASEVGPSGILPDPDSGSKGQNTAENLQGLSREQRHGSFLNQSESGAGIDVAGDSLLALLRAGIGNDFETVVFPQYPDLREIKRQLMEPASEREGPALYAALSGSGSALFGLYRSPAEASAAQQRLQSAGVEALVTSTISRRRFWSEMFAE